MTLKMAEYHPHPGSFRDPAGFVFSANDIYYRQVNRVYAEDYELLIRSGLYRLLTENGSLIPHVEIAENMTGSPEWYKTLLPEQLPCISYPYEWSIEQLRDAALLTLAVMKSAVGQGMILKDASPYNIQFHQGKPIFIDSLSFEKHDPSGPWVAYRQFCECFLFPLLLEHYHAFDARKLLSVYPEGIPASETASLLPARSRLSIGVWLHVHLQNMIRDPKTLPDQRGRPGRGGPGVEPDGPGRHAGFNKEKLLRLIQHLENIAAGLRLRPKKGSAWSDYYQRTIHGSGYLEEKDKLFRGLLQEIDYSSALDIGANEGYFSRILAEKKALVVAIDFDPVCINTLYLAIKKERIPNILPLCVDIMNPSPASGFRNKERLSFYERRRYGLVTALALIHHLVLGRNIPFRELAGYFAESTGKYLIIEFVPLEDEKAADLIKNKKNFHAPYTATWFEHEFGYYFHIERRLEIPGTGRVLYLMKKIGAEESYVQTEPRVQAQKQNA
jgi:hypothetical protein